MDKRPALWKALLTTGNQAFKHKQWDQALSYYQDACLNAYVYYRALKNDTSEPGIAGVLVCHFNIADTHIRMNQFDEATKQFSDCFRFLAPILKKYPENEVGLRAFSHSRREWITFKNDSNLDKETIDPPEIEQIEHHLLTSQACH